MASKRERTPNMDQDRVHEAYARLGHLGGEAVKEKYGDGFFSRIGEKGGQARKAQMARGEISRNPTLNRGLENEEPLGRR